MYTKTEEIENLAESTPITNEDSLDKIVEAHEELSKVKEDLKTTVDNVKKNLDVIVENMAHNPSMASRAAATWGEVSLVPKVSGGVMLTMLPLAAGTVIGLTIPLILSGVTAFTYVSGTIVLDDLNQCNKDIVHKIKDGIRGLSDMLETTIGVLDKIKTQLTVQINRFKEQNDILIANVAQFKHQVDTLTDQVECYIATEKLLRDQMSKLEGTIKQLDQDTANKSDLLEKNRLELGKVKDDYHLSQSQLSEKVLELASVRHSMGVEVEKARKIASTLQGTVKTLSGSVIEDKEQRLHFQERLDTFLNNTEVSYDQVAARVCAAEQELTKVKDALNDSNKRYKELLDEQEGLIGRLRVIDDQVPSDMKFSKILSSIGQFAAKPKAMNHLELQELPSVDM